MSNEEAIKIITNIRDGAIIVLNGGFGDNPGENNSVYTERVAWTTIAIDAIKKQIEMKPKRISKQSPYPRCGSCYGEVETRLDCHTHCPDCGQKVDWR